MIIVLFSFLVWSQFAKAQDRNIRLSAPDALIETGLLKHLLPRFTLKHGIRITVVSLADDADISLASDGIGRAVFKGPTNIWYLQNHSGNAGDFAAQFDEWVSSDVGKRTIASYQPEGTPLFSADMAIAEVINETIFEGDIVEGQRLSLLHCGRCHVIDESNRMNAIGSTPSFGVLRTLEDWGARFQAFYTLNPHPAFTQIKDVTEPFGETLPPPIFPLAITAEDLEAILAFVQVVPAADLGAPIQHQ